MIRKLMIFFGCLSVLLVSGCQNKKFAQIGDLDLAGIDRLMVVAHPDDETIWGGAHLVEKDYLVVCVSCGGNPTRVEEFKASMAISNDKYLMLNYKDVFKYPEVTRENMQVYKSLLEIIRAKDWKEVITHNPEGEYGHVQHQEVSRLMTEAYKESHDQQVDKLWYFAKYIPADQMTDELRNSMVKTEESSRVKKLEMIDVYKSQSFITNVHGHMYRFENWVNARDW